ncbi:dienelactone hydrolase family protein [Rhodopirellula halodulae]|uniref:dienelactone hydrolase family protein n=1 Tax=Rhodopirellula halodulae TaxID=2894198 RepID=UPI001E296D9B|nr:dienelactone hydrolase family protein [Rhodopirellula sp. JC737]MCC9658094.1 dienelactone hydrolase family protein [Rhodopirellula sp. JC737]
MLRSTNAFFVRSTSRFTGAVAGGLIALCLLSSIAQAEIQTQTIVYQDGDVTLEGFLAFDTKVRPAGTQGMEGKPGVLVVHQWMGLTDYERRRCKQLAELGYVAFALDIYGRGVRPADTTEAASMSGKYKGDRELYRRRLNLGLEQLRKAENVAEGHLAAIGYCFGGTGVLELVRSGAEVNGVVSFHGGLDSPTPEDGANIQAKILLCHGADDPFVPEEDIKAMIAEFDEHEVDWQMNVYANAVHSFTQPMAGNDNSKGAAYNEKADMRSWDAMRVFFHELFATKSTN